jgi:hypothetical protein
MVEWEFGQDGKSRNSRRTVTITRLERYKWSNQTQILWGSPFYRSDSRYENTPATKWSCGW